MLLREKMSWPYGRAKMHIYEGDVVKREVYRLPDAGPYWVENGRVFVPAQPMIEDTDWVHNLVVTTGKDIILQRLFDTTVVNSISNANGRMGVGNSATAAAVGDTALLGASVLLHLFDATFPSKSGLVVTTQATFTTAEANFNWQECALFNGAANGPADMFDRIAPIGAFNKTASVSIVLQIAVTQA